MPGDQLTEENLQRLYTWVDDIPLSRPKRNICRDFSDGGMYGLLMMLRLANEFLSTSDDGGSMCAFLPQNGRATQLQCSEWNIAKDV
jgi:hypothetical protein